MTHTHTHAVDCGFYFESRSSAVLSRPFPTEESLKDEDIYNHLEDLIEYVRGLLLGPAAAARPRWLFFFSGLQIVIPALQGVQTPTGCFGKSATAAVLLMSEVADE